MQRAIVGNYMGSKSHIPGVAGPLPNGLNGLMMAYKWG